MLGLLNFIHAASSEIGRQHRRRPVGDMRLTVFNDSILAQALLPRRLQYTTGCKRRTNLI